MKPSLVDSVTNKIAKSGKSIFTGEVDRLIFLQAIF